MSPWQNSSSKIPEHSGSTLLLQVVCNQYWPTLFLVKTTGIFYPGYYDSLSMSAIALLQFYLHTAAKIILLYPYPSLQCLSMALKIKTHFILCPSNPCMFWLLSPSFSFGSTLSLTYLVQPQWSLLVSWNMLSYSHLTAFSHALVPEMLFHLLFLPPVSSHPSGFSLNVTPPRALLWVILSVEIIPLHTHTHTPILPHFTLYTFIVLTTNFQISLIYLFTCI